MSTPQEHQKELDLLEAEMVSLFKRIRATLIKMDQINPLMQEVTMSRQLLLSDRVKNAAASLTTYTQVCYDNRILCPLSFLSSLLQSRDRPLFPQALDLAIREGGISEPFSIPFLDTLSAGRRPNYLAPGNVDPVNFLAELRNSPYVKPGPIHTRANLQRLAASATGSLTPHVAQTPPPLITPSNTPEKPPEIDEEDWNLM